MKLCSVSLLASDAYTVLLMTAVLPRG